MVSGCFKCVTFIVALYFQSDATTDLTGDSVLGLEVGNPCPV